MISSSVQLPLTDKLDSLVKLQEIPNHLELLEKVLLDSAMETFSTALKVILIYVHHLLSFSVCPAPRPRHRVIHSGIVILAVREVHCASRLRMVLSHDLS